MSLTFDAASGSITVDHTGSGSVSWTHTPVGTPVVATVNVQWCDNVSNPGVISISGITYGGQAMTQVGTIGGGGSGQQEKWILISPPAGAQSVVLTWLDDSDPFDSSVGRANSMTYKSSGSASYGTLNTATGTVSPITKTVSGVLATSTLDTIGGAFIGSAAFITITVNGTSETKRSGVTNFGNGTTFARQEVYNSTQTGSGSVTANATESANRSWGIMVLELKEVIAVAGGAPPMMMMGVGM